MTQRVLHISKDLSLPLDAVTGTFCIVGIRGSGKSNTAVVMAEEMLTSKQQILVLDPKDDWHGIRSSADGKSEGFPVTIFGGSHQDAPLEYTGGALLAELILNERISAIISTKHLSDGQRFRFTYDFCDHTYKHCREPMHMFLDEADQFAPQEKQFKIQKGDTISESMMLSLVRRVIKQGRTSGLGISLITQSPATLDKRVMNMCETLIAMRVVGAQDFAAVERWFKVYLRKKDDLENIVSQLPTLKAGQGVFYSPAWLEVSKVVQFRLAETFDSRKTPKVGERRIEPKILAPVDLKKISDQMAATIEKAKATDPKELQKTINELRGQVRKLESAKPAVESKTKIETKIVEKKVFISKDLARAEQLTSRLERLQEQSEKTARDLAAPLVDLAGVVNGAQKANEAEFGGKVTSSLPMSHPRTVSVPRPVARRESKVIAESNGDKPLAKGEREILSALIQYPDGLDRSQIGVLTGHTKRSTRDAYIYRLSTKGYVVAPQGQKVVATQEGVDALPDAEPLPTGEALQEYWLARLPAGERQILEYLISVYPATADREVIGEATGYDKRSTRDAYIYRLSQKQLVVSNSSGVAASENLF